MWGDPGYSFCWIRPSFSGAYRWNLQVFVPFEAWLARGATGQITRVFLRKWKKKHAYIYATSVSPPTLEEKKNLCKQACRTNSSQNRLKQSQSRPSAKSTYTWLDGEVSELGLTSWPSTWRLQKISNPEKIVGCTRTRNTRMMYTHTCYLLIWSALKH